MKYVFELKKNYLSGQKISRTISDVSSRIWRECYPRDIAKVNLRENDKVQNVIT